MSGRPDTPPSVSPAAVTLAPPLAGVGQLWWPAVPVMVVPSPPAAAAWPGGEGAVPRRLRRCLPSPWRAARVVVLLGLTLLVLYQVGVQGALYRSRPVGVFLSSHEQLILPRFSVCLEMRNVSFLDSVGLNGSAPASDFQPLGLAPELWAGYDWRVPLEDAWRRSAPSLEDTLVSCNGAGCLPRAGSLDTPLGRWTPAYEVHAMCYTFTPNASLEFDKPGLLWTRQGPRLELRAPAGAQFVVHVHGERPFPSDMTVFHPDRHTYVRVPAGRRVNLRVLARLTEHLSRPGTECDPRPGHDRQLCQARCAWRNASRAAGCRLPYMQLPGVPVCRSFAGLRRATDVIQQMVITDLLSSCPCLPACHDTEYRLEPASRRGPADRARVYVLWDGAVDARRELVNYSFNNLVSDVGGSLGLFLGVSAASLYLWLEAMAKSAYRRSRCTAATQRTTGAAAGGGKAGETDTWQNGSVATSHRPSIDKREAAAQQIATIVDF